LGGGDIASIFRDKYAKQDTSMKQAANFSSILKEATSYSETSGDFKQTISYYIPEMELFITTAMITSSCVEIKTVKEFLQEYQYITHMHKRP
jgi:hypothetical protein